MSFTDCTLYQIEPVRLPRRERLREAIAFLKGPHPRSATSMRNLLTASEFRAYKEMRDACFPSPTLRERDVLRQYNFNLHRGDALYKRATKLPSVGFKAIKRGLLLAEGLSHYCQAHEMLGELLHQNPALACLFDRPWSDGDGQPEEPEGMPRRTNDSSEYTLHTSRHPAAATISEAQRHALAHSLATMERNG
jgi:hypothetical protein